jgi:hypothetical protein
VAFGYLKMNRLRRARSHSHPAQGCSTDIHVCRPTEIDSFPVHKEGGLKPQSLRYDFLLFLLPPFKSPAKLGSYRGELSGMTIQAPPRWERVGVDRDMDAILTKQGFVWGGAFGYFSRCREKWLAHLLNINYEVLKALVCEIIHTKPQPI